MSADPPPQESWLDLLLSGAPASRLHDHRDRLLADAGPAARQAVESEAERALRVHALLEEKKRHSEELTVLNDLARRLSSLRDTAGVLQEVCSQARRLLAVDVAYIMLTREDGTLRIEVVDGSIGSTLRGVELAPGTGLGGQVIASGRALWVGDYLTDTRVHHVPDVDRAAADERLGGILGVPLSLGDSPIGVLLAADRSRRTFTDREVGLLASLASHAAIAIHNATVFDRMQRTADDLAASNRRLQRSSELERAAVELYHRLTRSLVTGASLPVVCERLAEAVDGRIEVLDDRERLLAVHANGVEDGHGVDDRMRAALGPEPAAVRFAATAAPAVAGRLGSTHLLLAPITLQDGFAGCVLAQRHKPFDEEAVVLVESGAGAIGLSLASERAVAEAERRARGELLTALLVGDVDGPAVRRRARSAGVDLEAVRSVAVLDLSGPHGSSASSAVELGARLGRERGGWTVEHGGRLVLLMPGLDAASVVRRAAELAGGRLPCVLGAADCEGGHRATREAYDAARRTADVLLALGRRTGSAVASELGLYRNLLSHSGRDEIARFVDATLGRLLAYDRDRGRDLTGTLATYLEQARHHARTCQRLHIHANTLYARLERIGELLGDDWRTPDRVLDLQLALRLHRLATRLGDD